MNIGKVPPMTGTELCQSNTRLFLQLGDLLLVLGTWKRRLDEGLVAALYVDDLIKAPCFEDRSRNHGAIPSGTV